MLIQDESNGVVFGGTEFFRELSPFYNESNIVSGYFRYSSLVHYWLASKYDELKGNMYSYKTPESIINYCKKRYGFIDFDEIDGKQLVSGVILSLKQNPSICDMLYTTSGYHLTFKGSGYLAENNRYGRLLEYLRDTYDRESFK